jgi:16S rRNA C1402 (ribose-2'-O) methylase RsmI
MSNYSVVQSSFEYAEFVFQGWLAPPQERRRKTKTLEVVWKNSKKRGRTQRNVEELAVRACFLPLIISRSPKF